MRVLCAMMLSSCLSVCLFVRLSPGVFPWNLPLCEICGCGGAYLRRSQTRHICWFSSKFWSSLWVVDSVHDVCVQCFQTADGLAFLHSAKPTILHRDLRSANILMDNTGHVKVGYWQLSWNCFSVNASVSWSKHWWKCPGTHKNRVPCVYIFDFL